VPTESIEVLKRKSTHGNNVKKDNENGQLDWDVLLSCGSWPPLQGWVGDRSITAIIRY